MAPITTSVFDLFEVGPGPSSSHTIGPMKAGFDFLETAARLPPDLLRRAAGIRVHLYGSLSATGRGHGTDRAVLAGMLGNRPDRCPPDVMDDLARQESAPRQVKVADRTFPLAVTDICFDRVQHDFPFSNTLVIRLSDPAGAALFEREYYSVGGGFLQWKGEPAAARGEPAYPYENAAGFQEQLDRHGLAADVLILENEKAITGRTEAEIADGLDFILENMEQCVVRGLDAEGTLPGSLGVHRKARRLFTQGSQQARDPDRFLARLSACAFAASEENAAGHRIVTAPTCGSAGVLPAVAHAMKHELGLSRRDLHHGLLAAAAVGFLCKHNASLAGAEVGCQGEVGVATGMAAAMLAGARTRDGVRVAHAAEIALEHQLGLTCDPVGGYAQIPCIERNAVGAVKAYNAWLIAALEDPSHHKVRLDAVVRAMAECGRDMNRKYKETSLGGLAVSMVNC